MNQARLHALNASTSLKMSMEYVLVKKVVLLATARSVSLATITNALTVRMDIKQMKLVDAISLHVPENNF